MPLSKRRRSKSQPEQLQEGDHAMQMLSPFEFEDDWWSSPATEHKADEGGVDPLLHFPTEHALESESTLKGISLTPPALPVAQLPAAQGAPGTRRAVKKSPRAEPGFLGVDPKGKAISPRESHILSERQRRKGMNHLFTTLASLLPDNFSKSDKSTIVSEIIVYIHSLRKELEELDKKRSEALRSSSVRKTESGNSQHSACTVQHVPDKMMKVTDVVVKSGQVEEMHSTRAPNVVLSVCGNDVFITISSSTEVKNLFSKALMIIQQHNLTFVDANISNSSSKTFHYFHVKALQAQHLPKDDTLQKQLQSLTTADPSSLSMTVL